MLDTKLWNSLFISLRNNFGNRNALEKKKSFIIQTNIKKLRGNKIARKIERKGHLYSMLRQGKKKKSLKIHKLVQANHKEYNFFKQDLYVELSRNNIR